MLCQVRGSESDLLRLAAENPEGFGPCIRPSGCYFREELDALLARPPVDGQVRQRSFSGSLLPKLGAAAQGLSACCTGLESRRRVAQLGHVSKPPAALCERLVLFIIDYDDTLYPTSQLGSAVLQLQRLEELAQAQATREASQRAVEVPRSPRCSSLPPSPDTRSSVRLVLDDSIPYPSSMQLDQHPSEAADEMHADAPLAVPSIRPGRSPGTPYATSEITSIFTQLAYAPAELYALCVELDETVSAFLTLCLDSGRNHHVSIVTNADLRWVFSSSRGALPRTHRLLFDKTVFDAEAGAIHTSTSTSRTCACISARGRYGDLRDDGTEAVGRDPTDWKVACFRDEIERVLGERDALRREWAFWQQQQELRKQVLHGSTLWDDAFETVCEKEPCERCLDAHRQFESDRRQRGIRMPSVASRACLTKIPFDLFVIGDSEYEMEAARKIHVEFPMARLKAIKMIEEPSMVDIMHQLRELAKQLPAFIQARGDLQLELAKSTGTSLDDVHTLT
jgi:hypothetical protein